MPKPLSTKRLLSKYIAMRVAAELRPAYVRTMRGMEGPLYAIQNYRGFELWVKWFINTYAQD